MPEQFFLVCRAVLCAAEHVASLVLVLKCEQGPPTHWDNSIPLCHFQMCPEVKHSTENSWTMWKEWEGLGCFGPVRRETPNANGR